MDNDGLFGFLMLVLVLTIYIGAAAIITSLISLLSSGAVAFSLVNVLYVLAIMIILKLTI